jgi:hypothetical protein
MSTSKSFWDQRMQLELDVKTAIVAELHKRGTRVNINFKDQTQFTTCPEDTLTGIKKNSKGIFIKGEDKMGVKQEIGFNSDDINVDDYIWILEELQNN